MLIADHALQALVEANVVPRYKSIREATYGIVFFSTPHQAGEPGSLGKIASKIAQATMPDPRNSFLDALENDSLFTNTTFEDFRSQLEECTVISFYETQPLPHIDIVGRERRADVARADYRSCRSWTVSQPVLA